MLTPTEVQTLLDELCETGGFCLPPVARERLCLSPPQISSELADAVLRAEGLDPETMDRQTRRSVQAFVSDWTERHLQARVEEALNAISNAEAASD